MSEEQKKFMSRAIELAANNVEKMNGGPFGAVVVKDGKIIAEAGNRVLSDNDPTAHAEIVAIRKACEVLGTYQLENCEIYASCEPCPMCLGAIYWARPGKYYYAATRDDAADAGFDDSYIYKELPRQPHERSIKGIQIMQEEARDAFKRWKNSVKEIPY
ncbi:MAG: nucleoside deaminase [Bacteroidales bacterium]|nr:nucleoside deaminase [Bacteroidales bacterium]